MEQEILYSALLHDIGKLIIRAEGFKQNHSFAGVDYLERFDNEKLKKEQILDCIKYHHAKNLSKADLKNSHIAYIIYEADNIASGVDRKEDIEQEHIELKNKWSNFDKTLCLSSVFNNIGEKTNYIYKLRDLKEETPNYPIDDEKIIAPQEQYQNIKVWIDKNIQNINNPNSLLQLLESTMSFVPSSTNTKQIPDVSLYDHLKLTASIASCIYHYLVQNNISDFKNECFSRETINENRNKNYYRLVTFDISGIQNFIYTISSQKALRSLRARSFYLEFLMEHIIDELLENLKLARTNILYSGAGHSFLLLPNTKKTEEILQRVQQNVNSWFLKKFSTELYLSYADIECSSNDLINSKEKFKELSKKLSKSKLQRYTNEQLEEIFTLKKPENNYQECKICKNSCLVDEKNVCEFCKNLSELGRYLVQEKDFAIVVSCEKENFSIELPTIGKENKYFKIIENKESLVAQEDKRYYAINDFSSGDYYSTNIWVGDYCCRFPNNKAYSFDDFANETSGIKRIAVFRADVDNLGSIFTKGFEQYSSISRYATLSRMLNLFYKHYINDLCKNKKLVIVYSGGDDVFVVGSWMDVLIFAKELREAFYKYSCQKLTLSAGVGLFSCSYPISKMAELTGILEDFAKQNNDNSKDSIALFGENKTKKGENIVSEQLVFTYKEFDEILELQKFIEERCYFSEKNKEENKIFFSTVLMYKMMTLINDSEKISLARFAYVLAKLEKNSVFYTELKAKLYEIYQKDKKKLLTALNLIIYKNRK